MRVPLHTAGLLVPKSTRLIFVYTRFSRHASSSSSSSTSPPLSDELSARHTQDQIRLKEDSSIVFEMPAPTINDVPTLAMEPPSSPETTVSQNTSSSDVTSVKTDPPRPAAAAPTVSSLLSASDSKLSPLSSSSSPDLSSSAPSDRSSSTASSITPSPLPSTTSPSPNPVGSTTYPHDLQSLLAAHPALAAQYNTLTTRATKVSAQFQTKADALKQDTLKNLATLGRKLNEFTGYDEIERLKQGVRDKENQMTQLRSRLLELKATYLGSVTNRSTSQRELNDLLQRKHLWSTADVERFTSLVRGDHENMRLEEESKKSLEDAEVEVERGFTEMMNSILNRYHEEQLWSDKLRSFSTYVSLTIMIANLIVFITAIIFVEPWKRKRMVESFETKVEEMRVGLEKKLDVVGLGLSTGAGAEAEQSYEVREGEEKRLQDGLDLSRELWEEIKLLKAERDQARLQVQPPITSLSLPASSSLLEFSLASTTPTPPTFCPPVISFHQSYPYVTLSYQSFSNLPQTVIQSSSQALSSTRSFLLSGWNNEGTERDLVIVGAGAAISGGLIVGILKEMMK
ncbi:Mitochondrial distribution and morphology family 33, fungi [Phaffia rhodozyma]|uniref:Sensitive to high expression protein 9, mitochondrial n=1 Tax=Phaffia rhodozyma TaxID=264483 RepID=A0A0F7SWL0_PHARH|nr:Mitochondrial distribution and morphology family 33, fungi [Phaffia rhodozyma]